MVVLLQHSLTGQGLPAEPCLIQIIAPQRYTLSKLSNGRRTGLCAYKVESILMLHAIKVTLFSCGSSPDLTNPAAAPMVRPKTRATAGQTLTLPSQTWPTPSRVIC